MMKVSSGSCCMPSIRMVSSFLGSRSSNVYGVINFPGAMPPATPARIKMLKVSAGISLGRKDKPCGAAGGDLIIDVFHNSEGSFLYPLISGTLINVMLFYTAALLLIPKFPDNRKAFAIHGKSSFFKKTLADFRKGTIFAPLSGA